jgi:hypothetical protein
VPVLVDTSALYALADADMAAHSRVRSYVQSSTVLLVLPVTVLPEADYMIATRLGQHVAAAFLRTVVSGEFVIESLERADLAPLIWRGVWNLWKPMPTHRSGWSTLRSSPSPNGYISAMCSRWTDAIFTCFDPGTCVPSYFFPESLAT